MSARPRPPTRPSYEAHLRWDQVAAFRMARHHLSAPARPRDLVKVVAAMGGAQAQLASAAQISLWARVPELTLDRVTSAIRRDRSLARAWCMRRTVYLLPSSDLAIFVRGTHGRAERELTWMRGKGVPTDQLEALIAATLRALDRPTTRPELIERVRDDLGLSAGVHRGGGWGNDRDHAALRIADVTIPGEYLLHLAGARGVICAGPTRGPQSTFVRADAWVPEWRDVPTEQAETELLRRYLRAFGPAQVEDFCWWTGVRRSHADAIWERVVGDLAAVEVDGAASWALRSDLSSLRDARMDPTELHLLPYFDSLLLGHRYDRHAVRAEHWTKVYRGQGWVAPVVLHRGRAIGTWRHARHGSRLRVDVAMFGAVPRGVARPLEAQARALGRYLGCPTTESVVAAGAPTRPAAPTGGRPRRGTE